MLRPGDRLKALTSKKVQLALAAVVVVFVIGLRIWGPEPPPKQAAVAASGEASQRHIYRMSPEKRADTFLAYLQTNGEQCSQVVRTLYIGEYDGNNVWTVGCSNGRAWAVTIKVDGYGLIADCAALRSKRLDCWKTAY